MLKEKERQNALEELRIMASLNNDYIIGYKEAIIDDAASCLYIIMEYADKGDLQKLIYEQIKNKVSQSFTRIGNSTKYHLNIIHYPALPTRCRWLE